MELAVVRDLQQMRLPATPEELAELETDVLARRLRAQLRVCGSRLIVDEGFHSPGPLIGALERFWALGEERTVLGSALMRHLRKHTNAQRLGLSTCKAGALPTELRPRALMSIDLHRKIRKNAGVIRILSVGIAQRLSACLLHCLPRVRVP